ncbi:MAG: MBL fold metallo-hydrolase [Candidatus Thermoplasmatota archaeon]|nr:MBL fold metallo-hydrolase [Candidatus Thermoplasmatota archaeon]
MKFIQHYSGSEANLYEIVAANGKRLLIECGCVWRKLQKTLQFNLSGIEGCLVSHSHKDHCKAVRDVAKAGIDVYCSHGTFDALGLDSIRRIGVVPENTLIRLKSFEVLTFATNHDCEGSLGFVVREKATNEFLLFATDTSHITQQFMYPFSIIALECSYDRNMLQERVDKGTINETLAKRLLTSHMEIQNSVKYIADFCDLSKCVEIHLLHLSGENIDKQFAVKTFTDRFLINTITA